jgi:hypothetical protein
MGSEIKRGLPLLCGWKVDGLALSPHYDQMETRRSRTPLSAAGGTLPDGGGFRIANRAITVGPTGKRCCAVHCLPTVDRVAGLTANSSSPGRAAEVGLDDAICSVMLYWKRKATRFVASTEMIQLADCGKYRHRVWHWYRAGRIVSPDSDR